MSTNDDEAAAAAVLDRPPRIVASLLDCLSPPSALSPSRRLSSSLSVEEVCRRSNDALNLSESYRRAADKAKASLATLIWSLARAQAMRFHVWQPIVSYVSIAILFALLLPIVLVFGLIVSQTACAWLFLVVLPILVGSLLASALDEFVVQPLARKAVRYSRSVGRYATDRAQ